MSFAIGESIGHYEIVEELGAGANGRVLKVQHLITRRREAMKVLVDNKPDSPEQAQRFLREIRLQASLDHPGIAAVHNAFWLGDDLVMIMELIEGQTLSTLLEHRRFSLEQSLTIIRQVLEALAYAHSHGVVHRDVCPNNIIVNAQGKVKLTDFGLAKAVADPSLTEMGGMYGSPFYISPEQVRGTAEVDARSDVYSTAVVLYELLTGTRPFIAPSSFLLMQAHVQQVPEPPLFRNSAIPQYLNAAILKAMAKSPADRFQSTMAFLAAVDGPQAAPAPAQLTEDAPTREISVSEHQPAQEKAEAAQQQYSFLAPQSFEGIEFESVTNKPWNTPVAKKAPVAVVPTPVWWKSPWFGVVLGLAIAAAIIIPMLSMLDRQHGSKAELPASAVEVEMEQPLVSPAPLVPAAPELVRGPRLDPAQPPAQQSLRATKKTASKQVVAAPKPAPVMRIWGVDSPPEPSSKPTAPPAVVKAEPPPAPRFEEPPSLSSAPASPPPVPVAATAPEIKEGPPAAKKKGFFRSIGRGIKSLVPDKDKKEGAGN